MMRRFRQKQLHYIACFLLALCGTGGLWAPGPGDDESSAAPTLKRKRSDDDVGPAPKKAVQQPESKKRRLNPDTQTPNKGKAKKAEAESPTDSQKSDASHHSARSEPVMSEVLALPEGQIHADARRDISFKKLMDDKVVLVKFLELFVPECKVGVEEVEKASVAIPELPFSGEPQVFMDFHAKTKDGKHYIIEMQTARHTFFDERCLFYWAATYSGQLKGKKYKKDDWFRHLKPVIALQVVNYNSNAAKGIQAPEDSKDPLCERAQQNPLPKGQFIKHYKVRCEHSKQTLDDFHMIQIELPRAKKALKLFPHGNTKKWDSTFFENFTDQQWFLSILRHAQDFTAERLESLKSYIDQKPFVKSMFEALKYQMWELKDQTAYKTETQELQRVYGATFLIEREHAREEGREEGRIDLLAALVQRQQLSFQVAAEYLDDKQTEQLKELVSAVQQATATTAVQPPAEPDSTTS
ncbi:MAG: PD-(D/E)XK nuclease family transposase [Holosporaceae bacterium]